MSTLRKCSRFAGSQIPRHFAFRISHSAFAMLLLVAVSVWLLLMGQVQAGDWTHWRGPEQNGVSREKDLPESWSPDPKAPNNNLVWKAPIGARTTPIIMKGRLYLINKSGDGLNEQERVMCLDANTGKVIWEYKFNVFFTDIVSDRLGWTNVVGDPETGNVYAHGTQGLLLAFDQNGKLLWSRSLTEEYGRMTGYGGRVTSPIVDGNLVIIGMVNASWGQYATGGIRFMAFDKRDGTVVWSTPSLGRPNPGGFYSVPVVASIGGQRLLITGAADGGVHALKVRTGEKVWSHVFGSGAVNCSPVVQGNRVYIGHGEENLDNSIQGRVLCLDAARVKDGKPHVVWQTDDIKVKFASPIIHEGRLYVCDETARLRCLDANDGKELWKFTYGRDCKGSPVWADGKIYVCAVDSRFQILKPGPTSCKRLHTQFFPSPDGTTPVALNGSPAVTNGRVYFCTNFETYCIGKKDRKLTTDHFPPPPPAELLPDRTTSRLNPAHIQVVPAEVSVEPGESLQFRALAFDAQGNFLEQVKAKWSLAPSPPPEGLPPAAKTGPPATPAPALKGNITPDGKLTVAPNLNGQAGIVVAKVGNLSGTARVRVVPKLPYAPDFKSVPEGRVPPGWINAQGKFAVRQVGDKKVLVKLANDANPYLKRANTYMGKPTMADYTIQADVLGMQKGNDRPDMGIVAQRYSLMLADNLNGLRLLSWDALPRVDRNVSYPWKANVWYRMKLTVEVKGDRALVRGKVWPRDLAEPAEWTITFEDPTPNREGSPGLYGNANGVTDKEIGTEIYYDNVSVTPNKKFGEREADAPR